MTGMLAVLEHGVPGSSEEALALAGRLATDLDVPLEAVTLPEDGTPEANGAALAELVAETAPAGVVAPAADHVTEAMAHLAARTDLPFAANCVAVAPSNGTWAVTRVRSGGVLWEDADLDAPTKLLTLAPGTTPADHAASVRHADATRQLPATQPAGARLVERATADGGGVSLATAPVVVSGGRGIGSAEGFAVLEELAGLIGGAVGCSRVATNNGWRPHSDQVGQTGTKIAPELYIAAGISGATQHWAGCMGSKTILAINTDPEAPMVTRADYAVIGDAQQVLRAVVDELRARGGR
ncbi:MAG: electron transfer flavoprotein subunit alpha/FixB family protein [Actinomycetota bacterium]